MKYVMFTCVKTLRRLPIIFSEHTTHSEVKLPGHVATSAGFVTIHDGVLLHGESQSLGLKIAKGDAEIMFALFSGTFESTWALLQDFGENEERLKEFCLNCGHLRVAHRISGTDDVCRCTVSGCKCEGSGLPKKS